MTFPVSGPGSLGMEAVVNNMVEPGDEVLIAINGVFGTRMWNISSAIKGGMPLYKYFGNIFLTTIQNLILRTNMSEFHSGYRSYKVSSLKKINLNKLTNDFHFDTQIIIEFVRRKFKILEIPIPTIYKGQVSHLKSIQYVINVLFTTIRHMKL